MAGQTTNYLFDYPTSTDYVKDGATNIQTLATDVDTTLFTALGGAYPGLRLLTAASFTTATSFSLPANTFSSTYKNYKLIVQLTALTADADFSIRLRASGTDNSSAAYAYAMPGYTYGASASNSFAESQTSWNLGEQDSGIVRYFAVMDIISPQAATLSYLTGSYNFLNKLASVSVVRTGNMQFTSATQFDSLSFISSVASSMTGTYRVYGYGES
jgi:hypothetical protein